MPTQNKYTTKTAALNATKADISKINVKKMFLNGENILDIIKNAIPTIKHSQDTRTTVTDNDLWGQYIETKADGTIIVHDDEVTNPNASNQWSWNSVVTKVQNNEAYENDRLIANIQTKKIKNGQWMFYGCSHFRTFDSDLSSLEDGQNMFNGCLNLETFSTDLSSLINGDKMFYGCSHFTTFTTDMSSLINCEYMFSNCQNLTTFTSDLSSLINGYYMFNHCFNLTTFASDLSSLTSGANMFNSCPNLTTFNGGNMSSLENGQNMFASTNLTTFNGGNLSSLTNGFSMFYATNLTTFTSDLSSLTDGNSMFWGCSNLTTFTSDLNSLTNGQNMFSYCSNLTKYISDLNSLTNGYCMFKGCSNLATFDSDLSSLTNGQSMFIDCPNLTTFTSDLSSLINGGSMFTNCSNLTAFTYDLSSLTNGWGMFDGCSNLTTFASDLSSLTTGFNMFSECKLDPKSIMYVADSIKDITAEKQLYSDGTIPNTIPYVTLANGVYTALRGFMSNGNYVYTYNNPKPTTTILSASSVGNLTLGINVTNDSSTIFQQLENFAQEATFDSWSDLKTHFSKKGWTVTFQYAGTQTPITYGLRDGEQIIPCQIFAKLVHVEDKDSAQYCTEDASTFYNIEWGHDVTDTSSYTQFNSLEDAMASWNVFPKENIITTEEEEA